MITPDSGNAFDVVYMSDPNTLIFVVTSQTGRYGRNIDNHQIGMAALEIPKTNTMQSTGDDPIHLTRNIADLITLSRGYSSSALHDGQAKPHPGRVPTLKMSSTNFVIKAARILDTPKKIQAPEGHK